MRRLLLVCLVPFAVFAADFSLSPIWLDTRVLNGAASISDILKTDVYPLGMFRGHHLLVSIDDIADPNYLSHIKGARTALVVSAFVDEDSGNPATFGALDRAVLAKLQSISPEDYLHFMDIQDKLRGYKSGRVISINLGLSKEAYLKFPIDLILIVALPYGQKMESNLNGGVIKAISAANDQSIANIVVPLIGMKFENSKGSTDTSLPEFFLYPKCIQTG
jgi:hypothetical protein